MPVKVTTALRKQFYSYSYIINNDRVAGNFSLFTPTPVYITRFVLYEWICSNLLTNLKRRHNWRHLNNTLFTFQRCFQYICGEVFFSFVNKR